jgi:hypothetical protein
MRKKVSFTRASMMKLAKRSTEESSRLFQALSLESVGRGRVKYMDHVLLFMLMDRRKKAVGENSSPIKNLKSPRRDQGSGTSSLH